MVEPRGVVEHAAKNSKYAELVRAARTRQTGPLAVGPVRPCGTGVRTASSTRGHAQCGSCAPVSLFTDAAVTPPRLRQLRQLFP